jgi:hypothetical protein
MKKDKFNTKFREYAKTLSPTSGEQKLVNEIYQSFNDLFGINNCIQIGSYPRYTSTRPIHDLDILYILGDWDENNHSPSDTLQNLFKKVVSEYINPTQYTIESSLQTHSVTVLYLNGKEEIFSVDIVPAYNFGRNEFEQNTYKVPEVIKEKDHSKRNTLVWDASDLHAWIKSDPRGYIKVATEVGSNADFRKTVKFVKRWKSNLCCQDESLKLKSFHLEQVITILFQQNSDICIFDAVFSFFVDLPNIVSTPNQISDRANGNKYIDDYIEDFTEEQRHKIKQARDGFLIKLEAFEEADDVDNLVEVSFYQRAHDSEEYLFDSLIPTFTEEVIQICGKIQQCNGLTRLLSDFGLIDNGQNIRFSINLGCNADMYKWKVKNDSRSDNPRGEITDYQTLRDPERTSYSGNHYVECYAIKSGVCVAKARQNVRLN